VLSKEIRNIKRSWASEANTYKLKIFVLFLILDYYGSCFLFLFVTFLNFCSSYFFLSYLHMHLWTRHISFNFLPCCLSVYRSVSSTTLLQLFTRRPLMERTHLDKICQIDWKTPLVEKCCVAGFFQLRMRSAIASLSPLAIDVYSYEHSFTKPYHVGHPPFYCSAVITTS